MFKRTVNSLSLADKLKIVQEIDKKMGKKKEVAARFNIPRSTLSTIYKNRDRLLKFAEGGIDATRKRIQSGKHPELEQEIMRWIKTMPVENLTPALVRKQAQSLANIKGYPNFLASMGWFEKFRIRNRLQLIGKKILKPADENFKTSNSSVKIGTEEFILSDGFPGQEGEGKPVPSERQNDQPQSSNAVTIKEEPIYSVDFEWNASSNDPSLESRPCTSMASPASGENETVEMESVDESRIVPLEYHGLEDSESMVSPSTAPLPIVQNSFSVTGQNRISESEFTNIIVSSGNRPIINHQIRTPEFFSFSEPEKTTSVNSSTKRFSPPKANLNGDFSQSPPRTESSGLSGRSVHHLECYGDYIVSRLKMMDSRTCLLVQKSINDIIFEAEMGRLILETRSTTNT